jgi:protein SCO1/2
MNPVRLFFIALLALVVMAAGWAGYAWLAVAPPGKAFGAPFQLTDQNGQIITEKAFQGHPTALFFGFTHCPEICPTTLYEMDGWLKALGPEAQNIKAYFVTVDPERDSAEILKAYVSNVSGRIVGVTGEPEKVAAMVKSFGVFARKVPTEDGGYTMDHSASVFLLNSAGDFHGTIAYGENPDNALEKLRRLAKL